MRITHLRLHDVKRHHDLAIDFAPGLTVVRGPNESGKTTIQRAIEMVLFRKPTSTAQELTGVRSWGPTDADPSIELDFEDEGVHGKLVKTFAGPNGTVSLALDDETTSDPARVDQLIAGLTGLPSEKFFRSTAGVRHQELADLDRDEGTLRDRLQLSMSGADRGTWTAKRRLDEQVRRYRAEGPKNPGPLKVARDDITRLTDELARGEAGLGRLEDDRAGLALAHERRHGLDGRLATEQADLDSSERAVEMLGRQETAQVAYDRYRRASELREDIARREAAHPSSTLLATLRAGVERLRSLEFEISEQLAELAGERDFSAYDAAAPAAPPAWKPFVLLPVVLLAAAAGAFLLVKGIYGSVGAGVLVLGAVASAYWVWRRRGAGREVRLQNELREHDVARRFAGRSQLADRLKQTQRDRDAQLASLGLKDLQAAETMLDAEIEHVAGIDQLRSEFKGLLGDSPPDEDVTVLRDRAASETEQMRHALAAMGDIGRDPAASRGRFQAAVKGTQAQREAAISDEAQAKSRVDENRVDAEQVATVAEELSAAQEHLAAMDRRVRIYEGTLAAIEAAEAATMKKAARYLEQRMGKDVTELTDGRYRRIRVDEQNLSFTVFSAERDDWVDARDLSQGTLDQLYLAARLGLVRQVTQDRRPPLIFDDPFVTFDDDRAHRAIEVLKRLAADHQVIYLTCSDRYDAVADKVIQLAAPTARDAQDDGDPDAAPPTPATPATPVPSAGVTSPIGAAPDRASA